MHISRILDPGNIRMCVTPELLCLVYLVAIVFEEANGTGLTISPSTVTIGLGSANELLTFECKPTNLPGKTIRQTPYMRMSMQRGNNAEVGIVSINTGELAKYTLDAPNDIRDRTEISGNIVSPGDITEQDILDGSYLKFTMNQTQVRCDDEAIYKCSITYIDSDFGSIKGVNSANLTTKALPKALWLVAKKNGVLVQGGAQLDVGDIARFSCSGEIGSSNSIKIKWRVSDITTGAMSDHTEDVEDGIVSSQPINCQYSLTSHMTYNVTQIDATRTTYMIVQCYLDGARNVESSMYYINPDDSGTTDTTVCSTTADSQAITVAVLGAVVGIMAVVILILGVCLWNERRNKAGTDNASTVTNVNTLDTAERRHNQPRPGTNPVSPADGPAPGTSPLSPADGPAPEGSYQQLNMATRAGNTAATEYEQLEGRQYESVR